MGLEKGAKTSRDRPRQAKTGQDRTRQERGERREERGERREEREREGGEFFRAGWGGVCQPLRGRLHWIIPPE